MNKSNLIHELITTYEKHGWRVRQVLLKPESRAELQNGLDAAVQQFETRDAEVDAVWFSRPSHNNREAWELRLLAETQYALFEIFESDETEEQRNEVKLEMESRLRDYANRG